MIFPEKCYYAMFSPDFFRRDPPAYHPAFRGRGIAGNLLSMAVDDLKANGISPVYLVTDLIGFYERYGWEFLCMVQGDGEPDLSRMYMHR